MVIKRYKGRDFYSFCQEINAMADIINMYPIKVLYGFKWSKGGGVYVDILFREVFNINIDYVIDDEEFTYRNPIYKDNLFDYLNKEETIVIDATGDKDNEVKIQKLGYEKGHNYINMCESLNLDVIGYIEYLEKKYLLNINQRKTIINIKDISEDFVKYGPSRSVSMPLLCQYLTERYPHNKVLDVGCGKGGAIITFKDFGYEKVDGVEYLDELAEIARKNISNYEGEKTNCEIYCGNALLFEKYDEYDLIYIYDSFRGDTFSKFIDLLIESEQKNPRALLFVYSNPFEHKEVIRRGKFKLVDQLEGDWFSRFVNIYEFSG